MSGIVYIVSAPSGSGKSTLVNEMMKLVPGLQFSISYTTRKPRGSEQNGREYFFVQRETFERMIEGDEFLEWAEVFGEYYGTSFGFLTESAAQGKDLVLDIDVQGARQVKSRLPEAVSTFILPPSRQVLESRLKRRSEAERNVAPEIVERRLKAARHEIENYSAYDYLLINDELDRSIDQLQAIVKAERIRQSGRALTDEDRQTMETAEACRLENMRSRVDDIVAGFISPVQQEN